MYDREFLKTLKAAQQLWEASNPAGDEGGEKPFADLSGVPIQRVYSPLDLEARGFDYLEDLGFPGDYPYTRGIDAAMFRRKLWLIRQYGGIASARESNKLLRELIASGQTAVGLAYDLPTQLGYDPDHPRAAGEVGLAGLTLKSLRDWEVLFDGIDFRGVFVNSVANAQAAVILAIHVALARKRGLPLDGLRGSVQNDILKEYICRGNYIFPVDAALRLVTDTIEFCVRQVPLYWPVSPCGIHLQEAGANGLHEAAITLANAFTYLEAAMGRGLAADDIAPKFSFVTSNNHIDFFSEIAKLRAMRKMWARKLRTEYGARRPDSVQFRIVTQQGGSTLTKSQPLNNTARCTLSALIGVLAGAQHIGLRTIDEGFGIPAKDAQVLSIRLQQVLAEETNIPNTVDPLGGSYFIESLTKDYESQIDAELTRIRAQGGMTACIQSGAVQRQILQDAYRLQRGIDRGEFVRVGENKYTEAGDTVVLRPHRHDPETEAQQIADLHELRRARDQDAVRRALDDLRTAASREASSAHNLMSPILSAVEAYATMGEMCQVLRDVFGEYREPSVV
ncbi:MAG: methylmalonyl-CoA mutase [Candidatus Rokubacteria bacterium]|nr:methylmalonyl-CoA mutase [Candidatus Rokubacteria bacterium]